MGVCTGVLRKFFITEFPHDVQADGDRPQFAKMASLIASTKTEKITRGRLSSDSKIQTFSRLAQSARLRPRTCRDWCKRKPNPSIPCKSYLFWGVVGYASRTRAERLAIVNVVDFSPITPFLAARRSRHGYRVFSCAGEARPAFAQCCLIKCSSASGYRFLNNIYSYTIAVRTGDPGSESAIMLKTERMKP